MVRGPAKTPSGKKVHALKHVGVARKNIPTAEYQSVAERLEEVNPVDPVHYPRRTPLTEGDTRTRDPDLDPQIIWKSARIRLSPEQVRQLQEKGELEIDDAQLVWRGKDSQDWSDLIVIAPPLYIQEKVHPKAIIDDLVRRTKAAAIEKDDAPDLFADFNGLTDPEARTEFYQHDQNWSNRMILGDSLQVMASLAEREGLRGKVQCIYFDPPYGIKFNSNWQVSTQSKNVIDGKREDVSREPEQVKAFRDTWKDGIHSYLTYLRDRLTVMRDLLAESGSIFVQIGDENVHRVRAVLDEVFGPGQFKALIAYKRLGMMTGAGFVTTTHFIIWYAKSLEEIKERKVFAEQIAGVESGDHYSQIEDQDTLEVRPIKTDERGQKDLTHGRNRAFQLISLATGGYRLNTTIGYTFRGELFHPGANKCWRTVRAGLDRIEQAQRILKAGKTIRYKQYLADFPLTEYGSIWEDTARDPENRYVVQTPTGIIERCILMATDPGDLVLDPTCGSGTTAFVAEQWGRRWITIDTSRVALALARTRLMSARYPYYFLADTPEGRRKEQEVWGKIQPDAPTHGDIRQGFVYERAPHITLKSIANNSAIDTIWETWQAKLEPGRAELNALVGQTWQEWEIPREAVAGWSGAAKKLHAQWWEARITRQKEIDASIAKAADIELLYDRPYEDKSRVRVAGPFTVESLSPHRVAPADGEELIDTLDADQGKRRRGKFVTPPTDFAEIVMEHLRTAGVHQSDKRDTIRFAALQGWPGEYIGAEGRFMEGEIERRAGIFIGPEFGTLSRVDLVAAAREATDARFDVLIACAFNFDAHAAELSKLGPLPILKAKMNPDLHMADDLKNTGKGDLFVVFGEPDIDIEDAGDGKIRAQVNGVDVFDPNTGDIRSNDTAGIAAWFIDTDYNEESFFVRQAYFLGANDPYKSLKTALQAEIDRDAWETLYRAESRPFPRPATGKIAVKVINHFGDEVMKVFRV
jgi:adenine-specific DNA-methyltransferase